MKERKATESNRFIEPKTEAPGTPRDSAPSTPPVPQIKLVGGSGTTGRVPTSAPVQNMADALHANSNGYSNVFWLALGESKKFVCAAYAGPMQGIWKESTHLMNHALSGRGEPMFDDTREQPEVKAAYENHEYFEVCPFC